MWWTLAVATAQPVVVDRVIADVAGEIALASDVERGAALDAHDPLASPFWSSSWGPQASRLVDAAAIRHVAANVGIYAPPAEVVQARLTGIRGTFDSEDAFRAFLDDLDWSPEGLAEHVRHRAMVDRYLARNLQTDPADTQAWLAEARATVSRLRQRTRIRLVPLLPPP